MLEKPELSSFGQLYRGDVVQLIAGGRPHEVDRTYKETESGEKLVIVASGHRTCIVRSEEDRFVGLLQRNLQQGVTRAKLQEEIKRLAKDLLMASGRDAELIVETLDEVIKIYRLSPP